MHRLTDLPIAPSKSIIGYGVTATDTQLKFMLSGNADDVRKHIRELLFNHLTGQGCSWALVDLSAFNLHSGFVQYEISVAHNRTVALANIFWYLSKVTGDVLDPDDFINNYKNTLVQPLDLLADGKQVTEKLGQTISRAIQMALKRKDELFEMKFTKLSILRADTNIPRELWCVDEIEADQKLREEEQQEREKIAWNNSWLGFFCSVPGRVKSLADTLLDGDVVRPDNHL